MQTLGQRLRQEREARGLSISDVATQTRINAKYFEAIESDDNSSLPGGFFYRSFVRQYARLLEIPDNVYEPYLEHSLRQEQVAAQSTASQIPNKPYEVPPMPVGGGVHREESTRKWIVALAVLIGVLLLCTLVFTLYERWRPGLQNLTPQTQQEQAASPVPAPQAEPPKPAETAPSEPANTEPQTQPAVAETAAAPEPAKPEAPKPAPAGAVAISVTAGELTWVDVWVGSRQVHASVLNPGETKNFSSDEVIRVRLGNAGGVTITHNGKPIPQTGPRGQVRNIYFSAGAYEVVQPAPKKAPEPGKQ